MKQTKQWLKRGIAMVLAICMMIGLVPEWNSFKSEASSGYTELTFRDFGISNQTIQGGETANTTVSGSNAYVTANGLDKVAITGYITFDANASTASAIQFGNILQVLTANTNQFGFWKIGASWAGWSTDKGIAIRGQEIKLRITFDKSGSDYKVKTYINDVDAGGATVSGVADSFTSRTLYLIAEKGKTLSVRSESRLEPTSGYTKMSFWHYGLENDSLPSGDKKAQNMSVTTFDKMAFTAELKYTASSGLCYGGWIDEDGANYTWYGIRVICDANGHLIRQDLLGTNKSNVTLYNQDVRNDYVKVSMYFDYVGTDSQDLQVQYYINNEYVAEEIFAGKAGVMGQYLVLYGGIAWKSVGKKPLAGDSEASYDLAKGNYLVIGDNAVVTNSAGETLSVTTGDELSKPDDYIIVSEAGVSSNRQLLTLYQIGDVDLNGKVGEPLDLIALGDIMDGKEATKAAKKGADLDHDGSVGEADLALMEKLANGKITIKEIKDKYYPAALTYDFLNEDGENGDEVMPISGFFGPMRRGELNYLTEEVFGALQTSGVNLVNYAWRDWAESTDVSDIEEMLRLAEEYGIGYYVNDARLNTKIDIQGVVTEGAEPLSTKEVAEYLSDYSYYPAVLGIHVKDEPNVDDLKYYQDIAQKLNSFTNTSGYITMHPGRFWNDDSVSYEEFLDTYIENVQPQVLAVDDYPFNDNDSTDNIKESKVYFETLSLVRQKAIEHNLPFWTYVQAGGDFDEDGVTDESKVATEEETYWNVNTALAFGAKGISWFPLIPSPGIANTEETQEVAGLLDSNGVPIENNYAWATNANKQIKAIDEVLMKASSKGVIAVGNQYSYVTLGTSGLQGMLSKTEGAYTDKLTDVALVDATTGGFLNLIEYGALVGCFDYKDTESYYVVNYDVTEGASQTIKLTFDKKYNYYYVADGVKSAMQTGDACELTISSGKGVLVVLDSEWEPASWEVEGDWDANQATHMDFKHPTNGTYLENKKYEYSASSQLVAYGKYNPRVTNGTAPESLEGAEFTTKLLLHGDAHIRYGGTQTGGWYGLAFRLDPNDTNSLAIIWEDEIAYRKIGTSINPDKEKYGVESFEDTEFTLKAIIQKSGEDLQIQVYINDVWANDYTFTGIAPRLGNYMGVLVSQEGSYVILDTPEPKGFTAITTSDIGVGDTYAPADVSGVYEGESMDKVLFTANLDFKGNTNSCISFGAPENSKWNGIRFTLNSDGKLVVNSSAALKPNGSAYTSSDWQYTIPEEGEFHLQVTTEYVDFDRDGYKDDVRLGVWIDGVMQNGYLYFVDLVPSMGNAMLFHAKLLGYINHRNQFETFVVKAAPLTKTMADATYDLTESNGYTIPGTDTTLSKPGDYKVSYTQAGTQYSGNVSLYYEGDATMDGVLDARDLVRAKKGLTELTPSDVTDYRFSGVETLENTAVTFKTAFTKDAAASSCIRLGSAAEINYKYYGVSIGHASGALQFQLLNTNGTPVMYRYVYESDVTHIVDRLHSDELILRLEFTCENDDFLITVYINNQYAGTLRFDGYKSELGNSWNTFSMSAESLSQKKAYAESADIDNSGSVDANDTMQLRKLLTGAEVEKNPVIGVLSDIHLTGAGDDFLEQERFEKALNYYKENHADVIIMNADLINRSEIEAYQVFGDIVNRVYGDAPEGARPEIVMTGEGHEWFDSWKWLDSANKPEALPLSTTMQRFYDYMSEFDTQLQMDESGLLGSTSRVVNGYTFIAFNADYNAASGDATMTTGVASYSQKSLDWLDNELAEATVANPDKPIFVAIHQPPKNTVSNSDSSDGVSGYNDVLKKYPQVVLFTGHTHASIQRERSIYQGDYTVVSSGSLSYAGGLSYVDGTGSVTFENKGDTSTNPKLKEMAQALLVRVSGKSVDIERCDFLGDEVQKIKENWVLEDATNKEAFVYTDAWFASHTTAPVFESGAASEATVTWSEDGAILSFPAATHEGEFVYYYEITVDGTTKNYLTDYWSGIQSMATTCEYLLEGVASYSTISIRAVDEYGNKSEAITISK